MKPSEMRAEIERLQRLVNRKQATINRLQDQLGAAYHDLSRVMARENALLNESVPGATLVQRQHLG